MTTGEIARTPTPLDATALMWRVVELCRQRRTEDLVVLDVRELVDYMDYMVLGTGRSSRQNQSIVEHTARELKRDHKVYALSVSGKQTGTWICLDLVDVVLHVFDGEQRALYDLELLWADAPRIELPPAPAPTQDDSFDFPVEESSSETDADEDEVVLGEDDFIGVDEDLDDSVPDEVDPDDAGDDADPDQPLDEEDDDQD